jgi:hypothetical protein
LLTKPSMAVQAGYIASWQLSPARIMGPPAAVTPEPSIHPLPLELLPYTEALRQTSLTVTPCPPTDAPRTGRPAPGSLRRDPSHGPRGIGRRGCEPMFRVAVRTVSSRVARRPPQRGEPCVVEFAGTIVGEQLATLRSI